MAQFGGALARRPQSRERRPEEAFAYYSTKGVGTVVLEEKHLGSRALIVLARTQAAAERRFGVADENHLWFVAYLWAYTLVPAAGAALLGGRSRQSAFDRLLGGWQLWLLPLMWLWAAREWLYPRFGQTHALVGDWYAHATYLPLFLFGFALARALAMMDRAARAWKPLLTVAPLTVTLAPTRRCSAMRIDAGTIAEPPVNAPILAEDAARVTTNRKAEASAGTIGHRAISLSDWAAGTPTSVENNA